jgi:hypothetical protein
VLPTLPVYFTANYTGGPSNTSSRISPCSDQPILSPSPGAIGCCPFSESTMSDSSSTAVTCNGTTAPAADEQHSSSNTPTQGISAIAAAEQANSYQSFGPAYIGTGIAGDLSVELGFTTGNGEMLQRSGIGIYLRSDHVAHRYASQLLI